VSPSNPDPWLVLQAQDTYHYHNLPDLTRYLRQALSDGDWSTNIVCAFMAVYCLQLKKQKRVFEQTKLMERAALVNLLHGLLLGLYPYNTRHLPFDCRVRIAGELRQVLVGGAPLQFLLDNEALIQFAVVEYMSNVVSDFCPVEESMLVRGPQSRFSINQACENFRAQLSAADLQDLWPSLNAVAATNLPALYRQLKISNLKLGKRHTSQRMSPHIMSTLSQDGFFENILRMPSMPVTSTNMIAQIKLMCPDMEFLELQTVEYFWENVFMSNLPRQMVEVHRDLLAMHGACETYQRAVQLMHVCLPCALKSKASVLKQKFAYNCNERHVQCATCSKVVVPIHMLGRALTIRDSTYYLCGGCLQPTLWRGSIFKCANCEPHPEPQNMAQCVACSKKAIETIHKVIDLDALRITYTPLCFQHAKACVLSQSTVYDTQSLMRELYLR